MVVMPQKTTSKTAVLMLPSMILMIIMVMIPLQTS